MSEIINKQVVKDYDVTNGTYTFNFGDFQKYNYISLQVVWDTFNKTDATAKMQQKNDINTVAWDDIPTLNIAMTVTSGSETREHINFAGRNIGLYFNPGTLSTGKINVYLIAKQL
jgi:hypothetical protein